MRLILEYWKGYVTDTAATNKTQRINRIKRWVMQNQSASLRDLKRQFPEASDEELKAANKTASSATSEESQKGEEPFYVRATGKKVKGRRSDDEKFRSMAHYVIIHRPSNTYVDSSLYRVGSDNVKALAKELNSNFGHLKVNEETGKLEGKDVTAILDFILNSEFRNPQAGKGDETPT